MHEYSVLLHARHVCFVNLSERLLFYKMDCYKICILQQYSNIATLKI